MRLICNQRGRSCALVLLRPNGALLQWRAVWAAGLMIVLVAVFYGPSQARAETLDQALERTLSINPTINAEREKVQATQETLDIAGAGFRPTITLNGDIARQNSFIDFGSAPDTDDLHSPRGYSINLTQPLYRGGRTRAALNEADANIFTSREALRNVSANTLLEVATTYVAVVRDTAIKGLRKNNLHLLGQQLEATIGRQIAGVLTSTDVALARSRKSAAQSDLSLATANLLTSQAEYTRLTNRAPVNLHYPALRSKLPAATMMQAITIGKNEHPAIIAALFARDAAKFSIDQVRGERLPELSLEAGYDRHWDPTGSIEEQRTANIRLRARVPLYQGGAVLARIRQARAVLRQRSLEISAAQTRVRSQVVSSWQSMMAAKQRIKSSAEQTEAAQKALEGIKNEEKVGQRTVLDVLDAEQELLDAKVVAQQARGDHITAYFRLITAMGRFSSGLGVY